MTKLICVFGQLPSEKIADVVADTHLPHTKSESKHFLVSAELNSSFQCSLV